MFCSFQLSEQERKDIRKDIDKAVERLTRWENASNVSLILYYLVLQLKQHCDIASVVAAIFTAWQS